jgi:hypothetical protein
MQTGLLARGYSPVSAFPSRGSVAFEEGHPHTVAGAAADFTSDSRPYRVPMGSGRLWPDHLHSIPIKVEQVVTVNC